MTFNVRSDFNSFNLVTQSSHNNSVIYLNGSCLNPNLDGSFSNPFSSQVSTTPFAISKTSVIRPLTAPRFHPYFPPGIDGCFKLKQPNGRSAKDQGLLLLGVDLTMDSVLKKSIPWSNALSQNCGSWKWPLGERRVEDSHFLQIRSYKRKTLFGQCLE